MNYRYNNEWFERAKKLKFSDIVLLSNRNPELKLYEEELPHNSTVLDLGVGFGGDTAYFLTKGAKVDAVDADSDILNLLSYKCSAYKEKITTIQMDLPSINLNKQYDIIIVSNILHYLDFNQISAVLKYIICHLKQNGFIVFRSHSKKHPYNSIEHPKKEIYKYFFSKDDLTLFFPTEIFSLYYISEYYRKYNKLECELFGYDIKELNYKFSISAIFRKNGII